MTVVYRGVSYDAGGILGPAPHLPRRQWRWLRRYTICARCKTRDPDMSELCVPASSGVNLLSRPEMVLTEAEWRALHDGTEE